MLQLAVLAVLFIGSFTLSPDDAVAEPYPSKPIKLVVAQPPGGQTDVIVRLLGDRLSELWKTPAVVEYHGGAGGTIGADLVAKAPADGYTLLAGGLSNLAIAAALVNEPWYGVVAPAGTPPDVLAKLAEGLHETVRTREIVQRLEQLGYEPMMDTPAQFGAFIRSEAEKYAALIKRAGIIGAP